MGGEGGGDGGGGEGGEVAATAVTGDRHSWRRGRHSVDSFRSRPEAHPCQQYSIERSPGGIEA
jgi:hypothetical protein